MKYSNQSESIRLIERETRLERFPTPSKRAIDVAAVYPSPYRIGMSNLGFHFLFGELSGSGGLRVERAFRDTTPVTLESGSPLSRFEVIFFSISYEEDYINLVRMLFESGIETSRERRGGSPLIVAGGAAVSGNPFPLLDIVDIFCIGEGEAPIVAITAALAETVRGEAHRLGERLVGSKGIFVPGHGASFAERASADNFSKSVILTPSTVFPETLLAESGRGCPGRCAFCLARSLYHPFRPLPVDLLDRFISRADLQVGRVGLVSTAVAAHPEFVRLVDSLLKREISISFSSLRAEDIDEQKAAAISRAGTRSVSLAPESGSERVRFAIGKRVPDETYMLAGDLLAGAGVRNFTLYLMVGAPVEEERLVEETRRFLKRFREAVGGSRISGHLNPIIPKPWAPMQYFAMPRANDLERSIEEIADVCRELGLGVRRKSTRSALRQALISTGDSRVGHAIVRMVTAGTSWNKALETEKVDIGFPHEAKGRGTRFAWDAIEGPVSSDNLIDIYERMTDSGGVR